MKNLKQFIQEKRPNLSTSSITTYNSILTNLYKKVFGDKEIETKKFNETDKILKHLEDLPPNKRKSVLSALVIITSNADYREKMNNDIKDYNDEIGKQEKTESQEQNWVSQDEVREKFNQLENEAKLIYKKQHIKPADLQQIQDYIILCLLSGVHIVPRRSKDYVDFRIKNVDKEKDNYVNDKWNELVFNSYKTAKTYGKQTLPIPPKLKLILKKWVSVNPTSYLLFDKNGNPLTNVKLNQRFNKIFGKKSSVNIMRHSFLTDKFGEQMKKQKQLENTMGEMGSSVGMATTYIKND
jgi:integrase